MMKTKYLYFDIGCCDKNICYFEYIITDETFNIL